MLTFNIHFDVHAVSVGPLVVNVLVDLDVFGFRILCRYMVISTLISLSSEREI